MRYAICLWLYTDVCSLSFFISVATVKNQMECEGTTFPVSPATSLCKGSACWDEILSSLYTSILYIYECLLRIYAFYVCVHLFVLHCGCLQDYKCRLHLSVNRHTLHCLLGHGICVHTIASGWGSEGHVALLYLSSPTPQTVILWVLLPLSDKCGKVMSQVKVQEKYILHHQSWGSHWKLVISYSYSIHMWNVSSAA